MHNNWKAKTSLNQIIQVLDLVNKLYLIKFQVPGLGALVLERAGDLTLASWESSQDSIGVVYAQEQLEGFKARAFFHMCAEHSPHPLFPGA